MSRLPQLSAADLAAFLRARGFIEQRQSGSHLRFRHVDGRAVTVPMHRGRDLGRGLAINGPVGRGLLARRLHPACLRPLL
ncbi:MAG: type II toxin-antitoxin system HicA family toxin [bacterium]